MRTAGSVGSSGGKDAARMAEASGLALRLDAGKIPLREGATPETALTEGEDYELLFALPERLRSRLESAWPSSLDEEIGINVTKF